MSALVNDNEVKIEALIDRAAQGDQSACTQLFSTYREPLLRMVRLRMDRKLSTRVDASDVVQEANIEAVRRLPEYARSGKKMDFFLWLRWIANDKLIDAHRYHIGTQKRQVGQEVSIFARPLAEATSYALAEHLLGRLASPSEALKTAETKLAVENALNKLDPVDREVLVLRHFEQLTNQQTAAVLGLQKSGASRRYVAALTRLKKELQNVPMFEQFFG